MAKRRTDVLRAAGEQPAASTKIKLVYYIEEQDRSPRRYYVYYITIGTIVKTLFDICETREKAKEAIKLHKQGKHPTQTW